MTCDPHHHRLVRRLIFGLRQRCAADRIGRLVVGVSGGADSVALLRGLHLLSQRRTFELQPIVVHVHHHLRPPDQADADAAFTQSLAQRLQLPFMHKDIAPGVAAAQTARNLEATSRRLRYAALAQAAHENDAAAVATAHHADDQLETLLMRLIRNASPAAMAGIRWRRRLSEPEPEVLQESSAEPRMLIRPMLAATHADAVDFLNAIEQPWREDETNTDRSRTRARLRHEVLPVLRDLRPDAAEQAVKLAERVDASPSSVPKP